MILIIPTQADCSGSGEIRSGCLGSGLKLQKKDAFAIGGQRCFHLLKSILTRSLCVGFAVLVGGVSVRAQTPNCIPVPMNMADATFLNANNEYVLTETNANQLGSIWGNANVDLRFTFDMQAKVYFGDQDGADGITFALHNQGINAAGTKGEGIGFGGVSPSFSIEMDTYRNGSRQDPVNDHLAVNLNGSVDHDGSSNDLAGPYDLGDIEDGAYHDFRVVWNAPLKRVFVYFDGVLFANVNVDIASIIGTNSVNWGYTASTGGETNVHKVCFLTDISSKPDLSVEETVEIFDPMNAGLYALPGNDVVYAITFSNSGAGATDANSIALITAVSDKVTYYHGDIDGIGPETNAVVAVDGGSGLTFSSTTDVAFSSAITKPSSFANCTYSPTTGYDPNVRFICINPKGSMVAALTAPTFTVKFRAKIK